MQLFNHNIPSESNLRKINYLILYYLHKLTLLLVCHQTKGARGSMAYAFITSIHALQVSVYTFNQIKKCFWRMKMKRYSLTSPFSCFNFFSNFLEDKIFQVHVFIFWKGLQIATGIFKTRCLIRSTTWEGFFTIYPYICQKMAHTLHFKIKTKNVTLKVEREK